MSVLWELIKNIDMQDENQTQNNKESDKIIGKVAENKGDLVVEGVESVAEVPKVKQKEPGIAVLAVSAEAETAKKVVESVEVESPPPAEQVAEVTEAKMEAPTEVASVAPELILKPESIPEIIAEPIASQEIPEVKIEEVIHEPEIKTEPEPAKQAHEEAPVEIISEPTPKPEPVPEIVAEPVIGEISTEIKAEPELAPMAQEEPPTAIEPPIEPTPPESAFTQEPTPSQTLTESHLSPSQSSSLRNDSVGGEPQIKTIEKIVYKTDPNFVQKLLIKARVVIQERKRKKLDKIMTLFETKPQVNNRDVQKLFRTTKRSVRRYFDQLEKEGKIIQVGEVGRGVLYIKKP